MKKIIEALIIYIIVVFGGLTIYDVTIPRASITIDDGNTTIYYKNLTIEQADAYIEAERNDK